VAEYVSENGRVASNSQSAYVLALHFDLLPEHMRQSAADRLAAQVKAFGYHLTTGFVGTPYLCHVLSRFGHTDLAYELLNQESFPSWLYPVKMGATTIWERWDGIKPDGSFQDAGMNSFNHYAYGAIGDWLYRVSAGLDTALTGPGYKHITVRPQPGGGLTHVRAALQTPYGKAVSAWQLTGADFRLQVTVPANTRATVYIPASAVDQVTEGGRSLAEAPGISGVRVEDGAVLVEVGSGDYAFISTGYNLEQAMQGVRHVAGRLDLGSSLNDVLANEQAKAVLARHVGEDVLNHPFLRRGAGNQPLDALARFSPALQVRARAPLARRRIPRQARWVGPVLHGVRHAGHDTPGLPARTSRAGAGVVGWDAAHPGDGGGLLLTPEPPADAHDAGSDLRARPRPVARLHRKVRTAIGWLGGSSRGSFERLYHVHRRVVSADAGRTRRPPCRGRSAERP